MRVRIQTQIQSLQTHAYSCCESFQFFFCLLAAGYVIVPLSFKVQGVRNVYHGAGLSLAAQQESARVCVFLISCHFAPVFRCSFLDLKKSYRIVQRAFRSPAFSGISRMFVSLDTAGFSSYRINSGHLHGAANSLNYFTNLNYRGVFSLACPVMALRSRDLYLSVRRV